MINITLFLVAIVLLFIIAGFGLVSGIIIALITKPSNTITGLSAYFRSLAIGIDQFGNILLGPFLDRYAIGVDGYKFGNPDNTISKVLAENYKTKNLQKLGKVLYYIIDFIDHGHFEGKLD